MKKIVLILLLVNSFQSFGQKKYQIEKCTWTYTKPADYISRVDNFEKERKDGVEYIKSQQDSVTTSYDDRILFSIATIDSTNVILASYTNNDNIKNFTLKGYAEKVGKYLKENPKNDSPKIITTVKVSELAIDEIKFYIVSTTTNYTEQNYSYTSDFYIAEIQGKEFSIVAIYDNEIDKKKIKKSIVESTFELKKS